MATKKVQILAFYKVNNPLGFDGHSFDEMDDHAMMNDELEICCTLDSGFLGRKFVLKAVCDEIEEVD